MGDEESGVAARPPTSGPHHCLVVALPLVESEQVARAERVEMGAWRSEYSGDQQLTPAERPLLGRPHAAVDLAPPVILDPVVDHRSGELPSVQLPPGEQIIL